MKVCVIVPFCDERKFIAGVVRDCLQFVSDVIAVDDGSTDGGSSEISGIPGVEIVSHLQNRGKGAALRTGFERALERGFEAVITLDGDMQHPAAKIPEFIEKIYNFDVVIGYREFKFGIMPPLRILSNTISSFLLSLKTGTRILDSQSGYRAFNKAVLSGILPLETGFVAETEMLIKATKVNASFGWVSIPTIYGEEKSKMKNTETTIKFVKSILKPLREY